MDSPDKKTVTRRDILKAAAGFVGTMAVAAAGAIGLGTANQCGLDQAQSRSRGSNVKSPPKQPPAPTLIRPQFPK